MKLQGLNFEYDKVITPEAVDKHLIIVKANQAKERAEKERSDRLAEEKATKLAAKFAPAVKRARRLKPELLSELSKTVMLEFSLIASHLNGSFICAGSYPAAKLAAIWSSNIESTTSIELRYNDIDVYHGAFGEGITQRKECVWTKLDGMETKVNFP